MKDLSDVLEKMEEMETVERPAHHPMVSWAKLKLWVKENIPPSDLEEPPGSKVPHLETMEDGSLRVKLLKGELIMGNSILGHLREALAECKYESEHSRSRELSLVMTKIDEAILWRQSDMQLKEPPINEESLT